MTRLHRFSWFAVFSLAAALSAGMLFAQGQQPGGGNAGGGNAGGGAGGGNAPGGGKNTPTTPTPTTPRQPTQPQQTLPEMPRPVFISGRVMLDDGTVPPDRVMIERVCNGVVRMEGYTDSKGRFSIELGRDNQLFADASVSSMGDPFDTRSGGFGNTRGGMSPGSTLGGPDQRLAGCEIRAALPGFRSEIKDLTGRRSLDNPDVGTLLLHRLANVEGTTISFTSMEAPKAAKKAYEKGLEAARKKKLDEAQRHFEKAVQVYPKYATAWFNLGQTLQAQKKPDEARNAYQRSLEADAKFVPPYLQMALLAANEQKWDEVAEMTDRALRLNPVDIPQAYFYNAAANFNLHKLDAAERSAREGLKADPAHHIPKMEHLLGVILANKQDYAGAMQYMRSYLERVPHAPDAEMVRKQVTTLQERLAALPQSAAGAPAEPKP